MSVKVINIEDANIDNSSHTIISVCGNYVTTKTLSKYSKECRIRKIDANHYINKSTGQIKEFNHDTTKRVDNAENLKKTFRRIKDIINTNVTKENIHLVKFLTLTFRKKQTDPYDAYNEFKKFWGRFITYLKSHNYDIPDYISVIEPQRSGSFHFHIILLFKYRNPFIPNKELEELWQNGFTSIKDVDGNIDNLGRYLVAYMTDIVVNDDNSNKEEIIVSDDIKSKKVLKGERLKYYPKGMRILRYSKGLKKPEQIHTDYETAMRFLENNDDYEKDYECAIDFENSSYNNTMVKKQFNKKVDGITTFEVLKDFGVFEAKSIKNNNWHDSGYIE